MAERSVSIRLGTTGEAQVKRVFTEIGDAGDAAAKRYAKSFDRATGDVEAAMRRQAAAAQKLAAIMPQSAMQMRINDANGTGFGQWEGSARRSAAAFSELFAQQERVSRSQGNLAVQTSRSGSAFASAAPQIQDFVIQATMGGNVIQALVVQGGQLAGQLMHVEGRVGSVARVLMGPFGVAAQVALMVAAPFVAKLFEGADGADKQRKALEEQRKAVLDLAAAQEKALVTAERKQSLDVANIKLTLDAAMATRQQTQALLEQARAEEQMNNSAGAASIAGEAISEVQRQSRSRVAELERQLAQNTREMGNLQRGYEAGLARMIGQRVDALRDPKAGIELLYRRQRAALEGDPELQRNGQLLARKLAALADARDRELKAVEESTKAQKRDAETLTANQVAKLLRSELPGVQITSTTGGKHVKNSYHYRNQAVDFVPSGGMGSMTKDDVRRIFESRGIEIVELLGPGDKNHSDHFHVAWTKGKLSLDAFTDAAKRAKDEAEELDKIRLFTLGTKNIVAVEGALASLTRQTDEYNRKAREILGIEGDPLASFLGSANDNQRRDVEQRRDEISQMVQRQRSDIQSLAGLYQNLFTGGARSIWDTFKQQGLQIISELLARWTLFGNLKGAFGEDGIDTGIFGSIGRLFGGGGTTSLDMTKTNAMLDNIIVPKFGVGTAYAPGGWADVGEFGKERLWLPQGTRVSSARDTQRMLAANDTSSGRASFHFDLRGAVMTEDLLAQMNSMADGAALRGAAGGAELSKMQGVRAARRRINR